MRDNSEKENRPGTETLRQMLNIVSVPDTQQTNETPKNATQQFIKKYMHPPTFASGDIHE